MQYAQKRKLQKKADVEKIKFRFWNLGKNKDNQVEQNIADFWER